MPLEISSVCVGLTVSQIHFLICFSPQLCDVDIITIIICIFIRLFIAAAILEHLRTFNIVDDEHRLTVLTMNLT